MVEQVHYWGWERVENVVKPALPDTLHSLYNEEIVWEAWNSWLNQ